MSTAFRRLMIVCSATAAVVAGATRLRAQQPAKQVVVPTGTSTSATLSPGVRFGDMLFVSGQLGTSRDMPDSTIQGQARRALENVKSVVEAAGSSMSNVVKCTVFLVDVKDFAGMNQVYTQFFPKEPPARSTVVVAALVSAAAKVEIECIAALTR